MVRGRFLTWLNTASPHVVITRFIPVVKRAGVHRCSDAPPYPHPTPQPPPAAGLLRYALSCFIFCPLLFFTPEAMHLSAPNLAFTFRSLEVKKHRRGRTSGFIFRFVIRLCRPLHDPMETSAKSPHFVHFMVLPPQILIVKPF